MGRWFGMPRECWFGNRTHLACNQAPGCFLCLLPRCCVVSRSGVDAAASSMRRVIRMLLFSSEFRAFFGNRINLFCGWSCGSVPFVSLASRVCLDPVYYRVLLLSINAAFFYASQRIRTRGVTTQYIRFPIYTTIGGGRNAR